MGGGNSAKIFPERLTAPVTMVKAQARSKKEWA